MKKAWKILLTSGIVGVLLVAVAVFAIGPSRVVGKVKSLLMPYWVELLVDDTNGLSDVISTQLYQNNQLVDKQRFFYDIDNRRVHHTADTTRLVSYPNGYMIDLPPNYDFDFSTGALYAKGGDGKSQVTISKEYSPYDDVDEYINYYLNRFITNEEYCKANNLTLVQNKREGKVWTITAVINDPGQITKDVYTYVTVRTDSRDFYRLMFQYSSTDTTLAQSIEKAVESLSFFEPIGTPNTVVNHKPQQNPNWDGATKAFFQGMNGQTSPSWGIFVKDVKEEGINKTIPQLEEQLAFKFPIVLAYMHFNEAFPQAFFQTCAKQNRVVEFTYQITSSNNENLFGYTPNLDIYRGKYDDKIREFARNIKDTGVPILFRLNNEMNSDWTSYSGVVNLSDPELFISNWRRFYRIFEEEGVQNVIWIYNPNDRNYPPCRFNNYLAYYPGEAYVHVIGVTGYNTGTYYAEKWAEEWREFDDIYSEIAKQYNPIFGEYPWMITEFASSSIGGDKAKWIDQMFANLHKFPQIKGAVWFSYADYDPADYVTVSRPYWLDETPQTLAAFKRGIQQ